MPRSSPFIVVGAPLYLDIAGSMLEVLMHADVHKFLGRQISGNLSQRHVIELRHWIRVAWYKFQRHRKVLTNEHVSIKLRLKLFDAVVTPTILYGLHTLPLTHFQLQKLDALQRWMLRSIVGWVRLGDGPWRMTMHWTKRLALRQHSFASHVVETCGFVDLLAVLVVP